MRMTSYPSDVTDDQWPLIDSLLPPAPTGGRPRTTDMRDVVNAIFYISRTGCQWRFLPKDFPPKSTVWRYFHQWRDDGTLERIHDALRTKVRAAEKPYSPRTTASVDSQSVDTTSGGEERGRDNAKNVDDSLYEWVEQNAEWRLSIVRRPEGQKGWVTLPIRWTVERTFACLGHCRRLSKDRERTVKSSEAFVRISMIHLMLNRLKPKGTEAEFRYRKAA